MIARLQHQAAPLRLLLLLVGLLALSASPARAQMAFFPSCNFQEVSLAPCMSGGCGGNISAACCSSLNRALDAGHRCVCSLLLSNPVFASLVTSLLSLPLMLPLPGCFLYAPSLAACQATTIQQQQTNAPSTATPAIAIMADPPTTPAATVTPPPLEKRSAGPEKADGGRSTGGNGTGEAAPRAGQSVSRSDACRRHPGKPGQGTAYALTFLTVIAVSWINSMAVLLY